MSNIPPLPNGAEAYGQPQHHTQPPRYGYAQPPYGHPQYGAPVPTQTRPAKLGKIGFWILVGVFAATLIGSLIPVAAATYWTFTAVWLLGIPAVIASTTLGIIGLVKRERPIWWSIVSVCAIPLFVITLVVAFAVAAISYGIVFG